MVRRKSAYKRKSYRRYRFKRRRSFAPVARLPLKTVDLNQSGVTITSTASTNTSVFPLNTIGAGTARYERNGQSVHMQSVHIRGMITRNPTSNESDMPPCVIRMVLFYDLSTNGSVPNIDQVLQRSMSGAGTDVFSGTDMDTRSNVRLLRSMLFTVGNRPYVYDGTNVSSVDSTVPFQMYVKLPMNARKTLYDGPNSGIGAISYGGLFLLLFTNATGNQPAITFTSRVRFRD